MPDYILNVARVGRMPYTNATYSQHYCRMTLNACTDEGAAKQAAEVSKMFGDGFECTLMRWERAGHAVTFAGDAR